MAGAHADMMHWPQSRWWERRCRCSWSANILFDAPKADATHGSPRITVICQHLLASLCHIIYLLMWVALTCKLQHISNINSHIIAAPKYCTGKTFKTLVSYSIIYGKIESSGFRDYTTLRLHSDNRRRSRSFVYRRRTQNLTIHYHTGRVYMDAEN